MLEVSSKIRCIFAVITDMNSILLTLKRLERLPVLPARKLNANSGRNHFAKRTEEDRKKIFAGSNNYSKRPGKRWELTVQSLKLGSSHSRQFPIGLLLRNK